MFDREEIQPEWKSLNKHKNTELETMRKKGKSVTEKKKIVDAQDVTKWKIMEEAYIDLQISSVH